MSRSQQTILASMSRGEALRSHRDIEGNKYFRLHQPDGDWREVNANDVHALRAARLIDSNKKFPVATFWLTEGGREYASHRP